MKELWYGECPARLRAGIDSQINDILEASLGQLQARNHPHAEAVAAALNRTGSTERRSALLLTPSSPLRQRALQTAHASKSTASAGPSRAPLSPQDTLIGVKELSLDALRCDIYGAMQNGSRATVCCWDGYIGFLLVSFDRVKSMMRM